MVWVVWLLRAMGRPGRFENFWIGPSLSNRIESERPIRIRIESRSFAGPYFITSRTFTNFLNFKLISSNFTTMVWTNWHLIRYDTRCTWKRQDIAVTCTCDVTSSFLWVCGLSTGNHSRELRSFENRFEFESAVSIRFDWTVMGWLENFSNRPCLPIARSSQTTQTINGA